MDFARFRRSIPRLLSATLLSAAAIGAISGCSGSSDATAEEEEQNALEQVTRILLSDGGSAGNIVTSASGEVTAVVDTVNNVVSVYDTSDAPDSVTWVATVDVNTLRVLSTDDDAVFSQLDDDAGTAAFVSDDADTVSIGGVDIHPSDEYMVIGLNDADDNDDGPSRASSVLAYISLVDIEQSTAGAVVLPSRAAGDYIGQTVLRNDDGDGNLDDGDTSMYNVTGVAFSPDSSNGALCVLGYYADEVDIDGDGDADDNIDIGDNGEYQVGDTTIAFIGQDGFGQGGGDPLPTDAEGVRDAEFDGDNATELTLDNYAVDGDDVLDYDTNGDGNGYISILGTYDNVNGFGSWELDVQIEDARDDSDDHDADSDDGFALTGVAAPGANDEGDDVDLNEGRSLSAATMPNGNFYAAGNAVWDTDDGGGSEGFSDDDGLPTDTLFAFVAELIGNTNLDVLIVCGFGYRGFQASSINGVANGETSFVGNGTDKLAAVATVPSTDRLAVVPVNLSTAFMTGTTDFIYGEIGTAVLVSQEANGAESGDLGLSDVHGYEAAGSMFVSVANEDADDSVAIYEVDFDGGFDENSAVTVEGSTFLSPNTDTTGESGPGTISVGGDGDFVAAFNSNDEEVSFISTEDDDE